MLYYIKLNLISMIYISLIFFVSTNANALDYSNDNLLSFDCSISRVSIRYDSKEAFYSGDGKKSEPISKIERVDMTDKGDSTIYGKGDLLSAADLKVNLRITQDAYLFDRDRSKTEPVKIIGYISRISGEYFMSYANADGLVIIQDRGKCSKVVDKVLF